MQTPYAKIRWKQYYSKQASNKRIRAELAKQGINLNTKVNNKEK